MGGGREDFFFSVKGEETSAVRFHREKKGDLFIAKSPMEKGQGLSIIPREWEEKGCQ